MKRKGTATWHFSMNHFSWFLQVKADQMSTVNELKPLRAITFLGQQVSVFVRTPDSRQIGVHFRGIGTSRAAAIKPPMLKESLASCLEIKSERKSEK